MGLPPPQARGQGNLEAQNGPPPRCFLVATCTIWLRFPFWRRSSDRVAAARLFQGSTPPKIVPQKVHFQEVQTLKKCSQKVHFTEPQLVVSADKTSVVSAGKTSVVSADKTCVVSADKTSVVSQDIPMVLRRRPQRGHVGNGIGMSWETSDVLSVDTTNVLAADTTDVLAADRTDV